MLKASELRIGNWVDIGGNQTTISHIMGDEDYFDPIPLTPDIIVNAGFKHMHMNPRLESFYVNYDSYYPFWITISRDGGYFYKEVELKSVHQLQNLYFALTGEELYIDL